MAQKPEEIKQPPEAILLENAVQEEIMLSATCWQLQEKLEVAKARLASNRKQQAQLRAVLQNAE